MENAVTQTRTEIDVLEMSLPKEIHITTTNVCECGQDSDFGCHGIRNEEIYSEYYCTDCYNRRKRK